MARRVNQTFRKMPELQAELNKLLVSVAGSGEKAGHDLKEVLRDAAEPIRVDALRFAPVLTGKLRSAIFASRGSKSKPNAFVGVDHKIAPHGHLVEFGHAGPHPAPPHPFMRPAVEANRANVRTIIAAGVAKIVNKYR